MHLAAAKGTTQVGAASVARMRQEEYPAMPAMLQATSQLGFRPQNGPQDRVIIQNQTANLLLAIPRGAEREMALDFYCKKPRVSLTILIVLGMPSSYSIGASVSSGGTGAALF
jgi:hypothetical protein